MKHQKNVRVVICPPCGENVAVATKEGQNWKKSLPHLSAILPPQGREIPYGFTARTVIPQCQYAGYSGRTAFTLIELLVVVLIIGILAAVAVPQYQRSVLKSRFAALKNITRSVAQAQEIYHLSNGEYAYRFDALDLDIGGTPQNDTDIQRNFSWGTCYFEEVNKHVVICTDKLIKMSYMVYYFYGSEVDHENNGKIFCSPRGSIEDLPQQHRLCQQETGNKTYIGSYRYEYL